MVNKSCPFYRNNYCSLQQDELCTCQESCRIYLEQEIVKMIERRTTAKGRLSDVQGIIIREEVIDV